MTNRLLAFGFSLLLAVHFQPAYSQSGVPSHPLRLVVPYPAGSTVDIVTRLIGTKLSASLERTVIVDNVSGADGTIGSAQVTRSSNDGNTLLIGTSSPLVAVTAIRNDPPYDPVKAFTPIGMIGRYLHFVVIAPQLPPKTWREFLTYARSRSDPLNASGVSLWHQIATEQLMHNAGLKLQYVPYKGEPSALTDLMGGRIDLMVSSQGTSVPLLRDGKIRALLTTSPSRQATMPDVPTFDEVGLRPFATQTFMAMVGPAKLAGRDVTRINAVLNAALSDVSIQERMLQLGIVASASTPDELKILMQDQVRVWTDLVTKMGLQKQ